MERIFTEFKEIESCRYIIRSISSNDLKDIFEIYSDKEIMKYDSKNIFNSREETLELINKGMKNRWFVRFVIVDKSTNNVIGSIALHHFDFENQKVQIGYNLKQQYWNKGIMSDVLPYMIEYLKNNTNIKELKASIHRENIASIKLVEKLGFNIYSDLDKEILIFRRKLC